ncbi:helix-turn-helix transcriptional regulator [Actinocrinis puniceicyclus]|uniref:Helix-turn-helix transcriptional regulator n=1 Tax=Actinocrinis puniceicyclus TaxID=977794 RepID=A0A8J7WMB9_9ACTN|nr:helix-turn-helix transcriptional regulator [Actinocrinis puniceicyclus]MBS2962312.1 helix-turn-helix transcriptional regulator [Actinocrinis puniceicyclus]
MANILGPKHVAQLGAYIREQRENAQYSLRQLAQAAGVSNPYLSQIERGLRKPSAEILQQLAKALKISAETLYVQAGLLDGTPEPAAAQAGDETGNGEASAASRVLAAIAADPTLTRRQKQILREIYETFRAESRAESVVAPAGASRPYATAGTNDAAGTNETGLAPHETRGE